MAASVEYRNVMKEKEDDLSIFFEMSNLTMGRNDLSFLQNSDDDFDDSFGSRPKITSVDTTTLHGSKTQADELLDSENGSKTDYDWLLTPPCTPLEKGLAKATGNDRSQTTGPRSRLAEPQVEPAPSKVTSSRKTRSSSAGTRRSSSSGGGGSVASRHATPSGRPTLPAAVKPLRSSTPSSRKAYVPNKIAAPHKRSSTPTNSTARSSTPTGRPSILAASKSASPPPCHLSDQSSSSKASVPACHSSSVTKSGATSIKQRVQSRGISPTVKSTSQKSSELPGLSTDALPNSRVSLSGRPASASKEGPRTPNSTETGSSGKQRQKPYLSSKAQVSSGNSYTSGRNVLSKCRNNSNTNDDVNPVLMGTQMVERVVNMRKLAPPKQDDYITNHSITSRKPSSQESSGFGRSLSKKSLDMAIRHMDITRSISGNMRSLMKDVPASSVYSLRSESRKVGICGSTYSLNTSSDASSEHSCNIKSHGCLNSSADDIDICSEQEHSSSNSQQE